MSYPYNVTQYPTLYPNLYTPSAPFQERPLEMPQTTYPIPTYSQTYQTGFNPYMPQTVRPVLTQAMNTATNQLLAKAQEAASSVLPVNEPLHFQQAQAQPRDNNVVAAPLYVDLSRREYNVFSSRSDNHYHMNNEGKDDTGMRAFAVVAGLIVAGVSAYFLGKAIAQNEDEQEGSVKFQTLKDRWETNKEVYNAQDGILVDMIDQVADKTSAILSRQQTNRTHKIAMVALFFLSGSMAVAGGLMASSLLMGAGLVTGAAAGVFALYKLGYNCFSKRDTKDAQEIHDNLSQIMQRQMLLQVV